MKKRKTEGWEEKREDVGGDSTEEGRKKKNKWGNKRGQITREQLGRREEEEIKRGTEPGRGRTL